MPVTVWEDIPKGQKCELCKVNYATHYYGIRWICCTCHDDIGSGLVTNEEARKYHES